MIYGTIYSKECKQMFYWLIIKFDKSKNAK